MPAPPRFIPGFAYGMTQPSVLMMLDYVPLSAEQCAALDGLIGGAFSDYARQPAPTLSLDQLTEGVRPTMRWLLAALDRFRGAAGLPGGEFGRVQPLKPGRLRCFVPCDARSKGAWTVLIGALVDLVSAFVQGADTAPGLEKVARSAAKLRQVRSPDLNGVRFIAAARELGIPVHDFSIGVVQFGMGSRARWIESSFTDQTSVVGTRLARDKRITAQILRHSGIPVPEHRPARNADQAVEIAAALGYPVVVKPTDLDGGRGVAAGLTDADQVRTAFEKCKKLSERVLVEKHVEGRDYRVIVFQGEPIFAVERVPGGVTGNGADSIEALLEAYNANPLRQGPHPPLGPLKLDDEAQAMLKAEGLELGSVPEAGRFVRMRRAANIVSGGTPVAAYDKAHPDNLALAARAARALRLDLAGIDLIIDDIGRSWHESGAAICEVNAQPNLGQLTTAHLYPEILSAVVPGTGRIPVVLIAGAADPAAIGAEVEQAFAARGLRAALRDNKGVRIAGEQVTKGLTLPVQAGQMMLLDNRVDAMILCVNDLSLMRTGLPVDRYDVLVLAGTHYRAPKGGPQIDARALVHGLLPACTGAVIPLEGTASDYAGLKRAANVRWTDEIPPEALPAQLGELLGWTAPAPESLQ